MLLTGACSSPLLGLLGLRSQVILETPGNPLRHADAIGIRHSPDLLVDFRRDPNLKIRGRFGCTHAINHTGNGTDLLLCMR